MILNSVLNVFKGKRSKQLEQTPTSEPQKTVEKEKDHDAISNRLMERYGQFRAECRNERIETEKLRSWKKTGNHKMDANDTGLFVVRDENGRVVKTRDAMRRVREYRYDDAGNLEVNKFGVWNKVENGRLSDAGTLIWRTKERETFECLDGTVICISFNSESLIAHNEKTGEEVTISSNGHLRHLIRKDGVESFRCFKQDKLSQVCKSYTEPLNQTVKTMAGVYEISCVSRIEEKYENGQLLGRSYTFCDSKLKQRTTSMSIELPSGKLYISKVEKIENIYKYGILTETIFELTEPVSVSRDQEGKISLVEGISKIRSFQMREDCCAVVFIDHNGDENLFFPEI